MNSTETQGAQTPQPAPVVKAQPIQTAPTHPDLVQIEDVAGLPRVLLIGDSISMGYTLPVRAALEGRANVHHPPENCGPTERGLANLEAWLGVGKWDVIHFNFGLHHLKYLDKDSEFDFGRYPKFSMSGHRSSTEGSQFG